MFGIKPLRTPSAGRNVAHAHPGGNDDDHVNRKYDAPSCGLAAGIVLIAALDSETADGDESLDGDEWLKGDAPRAVDESLGRDEWFFSKEWLYGDESLEGDDSHDRRVVGWNDKAGRRLELQDEVRVAIHALIEPQRLCVLLFYIGGWSQEEIAEITGITTNAVKLHVKRARALLREKLPHLRRPESTPARGSSRARDTSARAQGRVMK